MLFNSLDFAVFLPLVFLIYWFVFPKNIKQQNVMLLISSYVFYGWWDWRFLSLILFSTILDYMLGKRMGNSQNESDRKWLLATSVVVNLGFLGFFKYYNFFADSFVQVFTFMGQPIHPRALSIVLPVGISFYTFQTLSYSIDVYKRKLEPARDFISFATFVSFFPQLVAGPIERATHLLPQFYKKRKFDYALAADGSKQMLWGFFKKVVIADNCAEYVNIIFQNYENYSASTLALGAVLFAFQIYGDFSGYSDIAIGLSRLFGFDLMKNFAFPYFSRDIAEFWRRWHISLSTWFRDYLYIPLGGSKGGLGIKIRNTFIIFLVSGFWHGANWTFVIWGALNALYFLPLLLAGKNRNNLNQIAEGRLLPSFKEAGQLLITFSLTCLAWVFFRAESVTMAFDYISSMFSISILSKPQVFPIEIIALVGLFIMIEWLGRESDFAIQSLGIKWRRPFRYGVYYGVFMLIYFAGNFSDEIEFIYFQF
ncbi:MBOAT family protein [Echinicola sp. CAU 1574]|uniref:MBOAT family protein n=1 Tax=Echinicola arenosa TaxID=2774144 RepID=A0ABR9AR80_9BACT|nr:MBOAT family protein [Echinicola arenosa]MBD8490892.1 MBOAT family protein [Echinicola arenosa]